MKYFLGSLILHFAFLGVANTNQENSFMVVLAIYIFFMLPWQSKLTQQENSLKYCDRGTRMEGLKDIWKAGSDIDFLGAYIDCVEHPSINSVETVQLKFYLQDKTAMTIFVREMKKNYWMVPHNRQWKKGWNSFSWSAEEVLQKIPLQLYQLVPADSAMIGRSVGFVVPFILTNENAPLQKQKYVFVFASSGEANIAIEWFKKTNHGFVGLKKDSINQMAKKPFQVWEDFQNEQYSNGDYRLQLSGWVKKPESYEEVDVILDFYHQRLF